MGGGGVGGGIKVNPRKKASRAASVAPKAACVPSRAALVASKATPVHYRAALVASRMRLLKIVIQCSANFVFCGLLSTLLQSFGLKR